MIISSLSKDYLLEVVRWAKFLAITGFVAIGIGMTVILGVLVFGAVLANVGTALILAIYLIMFVIYFFPTFFLYNFSVKIKEGVEESLQADVDTGFENLKSLFKFVGILTIIVLSFYILLIFLGIFVALTVPGFSRF